MKNSTFIVSTALVVIFGSLTPVVSFAQEAKALSMSELLRRVEQGRATDNKENQDRERRFSQSKNEQQNLLNQAISTKKQEESRSQTLEGEYDVNEEEIAVLTETLNIRLGSLKELFGVMQQVAGDSRSQFDNSLTNIQYPERSAFLENLAKKIGSSAKLPSLDEIEKLWFELQREMTETGKTVRFSTNVITKDGTEGAMEVVRVGAFNIVADGKYLN